MPLTSRQQAFLAQLFDVYYRHREQPIHYTALARALGVGNSTAYEMLRLLEQKGYVCSEYHLAQNHVGPGRSVVLFRPTLKSLRTFRSLLGEDARRHEWESAKEKVLLKLATEGLPDDEQLLDELIATVSQSEDPLSYCGGVVAASLVSIRSRVLNRLHGLSIFRDLASGEAVGFDALNILPGFALGLSCASQDTPSWWSRLAECVRRYQSYLHQMDGSARARLLRFSCEVMAALQFPLEGG